MFTKRLDCFDRKAKAIDPWWQLYWQEVWWLIGIALLLLPLSGCAPSPLDYVISGPNLRPLYECHEPTPTYPAQPNQRQCP